MLITSIVNLFVTIMAAVFDILDNFIVFDGYSMLTILCAIWSLGITIWFISKVLRKEVK